MANLKFNLKYKHKTKKTKRLGRSTYSAKKFRDCKQNDKNVPAEHSQVRYFHFILEIPVLTLIFLSQSFVDNLSLFKGSNVFEVNNGSRRSFTMDLTILYSRS